MKKVGIYVFILCATVSHSILTRIISDGHYPSLYYDERSFPNGIFINGSSPFAGKKGLIGWDLNEVVFDRDFSFLLPEIRTAIQKHGVLYGCSIFSRFFSMAIHMTYLTLKQDPRSTLWGRYLDWAMTTASTPEEKLFCAHLLMVIQKLNVPNRIISKLLQELMQENHECVPLTNMEYQLLAIQKEILANKLNHACSVNEEECTHISTVARLLNSPGATCPCPDNNWCFKPNSAIYQEFFKNNIKIYDFSLFIDDKKENVIAAIKEGFTAAIHFTTVEELENILQALGLLHYL